MTKDELLKMGLSEEQAESVLGTHKKELEGFIPKGRFDELNETKKAIETQLKERDSQLSELKKSSAGNEELKRQISELQEANKKAKEEADSKVKSLMLDNAVSTSLIKAQAKNPTAAKALLDLGKVEIAEDGTVKGLDEQIKTLKEAEDSKFLFAETQQPQFKGMTPVDGADKHVEIGQGAAQAQRINAQFEATQEKG